VLSTRMQAPDSCVGKLLVRRESDRVRKVTDP
jgi:hypothetical protein